MDEANLPTLRAAGAGRACRFHGLLTVEELQGGEVSVPDLLDRARRVLDAFDGTIDAITGYWDFPVSTMVPILAREYGTRATDLASVVKCEHKYWSRLEQRSAAPEAVPAFGRVDLDAAEPELPDGLTYPVWLKPALSYSSELAFGVKDRESFRAAVQEIREGIGRIGRPFESVMEQVELSPEMADVGSLVCLAEERLTGIQVAVEGYVHQGEVTVYGVLDSINYPGSPSFLRHQYPSMLPQPVIGRLHDVSAKVMRRIGMEGATFSIEFFYDPGTQDVRILEINPRHSQSHAELFHFVDGVPNHHCMLALARGEDPRMPHGEGRYAMAAKWYHRWFADGVVSDVPSREQLDRIESELPGVRIDVAPSQCQRLSDLPQQDSYSYELAHIFTAGDSEDELREKYDRCVAALDLSFEDTTPAPDRQPDPA
ncbi:acetyl-CoA carboxylase biotin carboxylase subunit family protein [Streptomyces sp. NPDC059897]|uniref:ATP-grasp domain-containing protein n=1 Tax=Streptomyces sp. NPDC059897 TaxID=3346994 RepID=UPI00365594DA